MKDAKPYLLAFLALTLIQWYVPLHMIYKKEKVHKTGREYKFRISPVDPIDFFRGKYIALHYQESTVKTSDEQNWTAGEIAYVLLTTDEQGFAKIQSVSKEEPKGQSNFFKAQVAFVSRDGSNTLRLSYPFDRFYMQEFKANEAEQLYWQKLRDTSNTVYALVGIRDGEAVLKDVLIDGVPLEALLINGKGE